jgi:chromosome segregation ATPase
MEIDERKLRDILSEQAKDFERHVGALDRKLDQVQDDVKRHTGVLLEETDRKIDLLQEGVEGATESLDQLRAEVAGIRRELEEIRLHLFRKADLERLETLERRVDTLEKRFLGS